MTFDCCNWCRYCRNMSTKPLWPMSSGQPSKADILRCSCCGGPRCFEFQVSCHLALEIRLFRGFSPPIVFLTRAESPTSQVLPQLLYYFGVKNDADSLDWATIVVYSCEASCEGSLAYKEEFAWVQLATPTSSPVSWSHHSVLHPPFQVKCGLKPQPRNIPCFIVVFLLLLPKSKVTSMGSRSTRKSESCSSWQEPCLTFFKN